MRRLLLMRHAKTEKDGPTGRDRDRRLDDRGRREAEEMSNYLARHDLLPDLALVSTAVRARQTWDRVATAWPDIAVDHLDDLYAADAGDLLRIIRTAGGKRSRRLLVIGHNPGLHELALALIADGNVEGRQALLENLPTSGVAVIDFSIKDWSDISFRRGRLDRFISPRLLREADDV